MIKLNDLLISKDFRLYEFESPDTNEVKLDPELVIRLQGLRDLINLPIIINSGYRTEAHNKFIKGTQQSFHLYGKAADIYISGYELQRLFEGCVYIGFRGVIVYESNRFIHVDCRVGSYVVAPRDWKIKALAKNFFKGLDGKSRTIKVQTERLL